MHHDKKDDNNGVSTIEKLKMMVDALVCVGLADGCSVKLDGAIDDVGASETDGSADGMTVFEGSVDGVKLGMLDGTFDGTRSSGGSTSRAYREQKSQASWVVSI